MNVEKIRKTGSLILIGAFGMVIIQLAAPVILGILVQGAAMVVPLAVYHFFVKEKWRFKFIRETDGEREADDGVDCKSGQESCQTEQEKNPFDDGRNPFDGFEESETERPQRVSEGESFKKKKVRDSRTVAWYERQGREKIRGIVGKLTERGIGEFWIRKDGICNIRTGKGYRRTGMVPGFSEADKETLIQVLKDDGIDAVEQGKYLYVAWEY